MKRNRAERRSEVLTFRPTPEVREKLESLRDANLNVSEAINDALAQGLDGVIVRMGQDQQERLNELLDRKKSAKR